MDGSTRLPLWLAMLMKAWIMPVTVPVSPSRGAMLAIRARTPNPFSSSRTCRVPMRDSCSRSAPLWTASINSATSAGFCASRVSISAESRLRDP